MSQKPTHLIERAAERLRQNGMLESSAAQLMSPNQSVPSDIPTSLAPTAPPGQRDVAPLAPPPSPYVEPVYADVGGASPPPNLPPNPPGGGSSGGPTGPNPSDALFVEEEAFARAGMLDWRNTRNRTAEEFRVAQVQILRAAFAPDRKSVV